MRPVSIALLLALGSTSSFGCRSDEPPAIWRPGVAYPSSLAPNARGFIDARGLIHAHSVYSHDACDGMPIVGGVPDERCSLDFREGLCAVKHDFVMLTDHRDSFSQTAFESLLLARVDEGDRPIRHIEMKAAEPLPSTFLASASWLACGDSKFALILPGSESGFMPVGLERHVSEVEMERDAIYAAQTPEAIEVLKANGAVVLVAHTEDWTVDQLIDLPLDGFEMYNLHANTVQKGGNVLEFLVRLSRGDTNLIDPNLIFLGLFEEDTRYLNTWGTVLARGARRVTTMGTDCHRNTFPMPAQDGERIDSYRRMMSWFSNHLLVRPTDTGYWDDRNLKEALRAGRLYGAFEVLGYPVGFDYVAREGGTVIEMGGEASLARAPVLSVKRPSIQNLDPSAKAPVLTVKILRAIEGGFEEVASGGESGELTFTPSAPGAYRAEVRIVPHHLTAYLGDSAPMILSRDFAWVWSNPIYVVPRAPE